MAGLESLNRARVRLAAANRRPEDQTTDLAEPCRCVSAERMVLVFHLVLAERETNPRQFSLATVTADVRTYANLLLTIGVRTNY
jgi:hypothetical protein